jgi:hypothetical protein
MELCRVQVIAKHFCCTQVVPIVARPSGVRAPGCGWAFRAWHGARLGLASSGVTSTLHFRVRVNSALLVLVTSLCRPSGDATQASHAVVGPTSRSSGRLLHLARSRRLQLVFNQSFQSGVFCSIMVCSRAAGASGAPSLGAVRRRLTPALGCWDDDPLTGQEQPEGEYTHV